MVKERCRAAQASVENEQRQDNAEKISTYIAVLPGYESFDWVFATTINANTYDTACTLRI